MDDRHFNERMAWRSIYEQRFCPPDDIMFGTEKSEQLEAHLEFCEFCNERLEMDNEERMAWQELNHRMKEEFPQKQLNESPAPGQVWSIRQDMLGGWGQDNRFYTVPQVLLLESIYEGKAFKVAQLFSSDDLAAEGDIILPDGAGFAESWNTYLLHRKHLKACLASLGDIVTRKVVQRSTQLVTQPDNCIIEEFRQLEHEFAKELSARAAILISAEQPKPETGMLRWLTMQFTPVRIASLAAMIVAIISIAVFNSGKEQNTQVAQVPESAPVVPPKMQTPPQATPQVTPVQPTVPAKPTAPAYSPLLTASADSVRNSSAITKVTTLEQQQRGLISEQVEPDRAAFLIGIAFVDLNAAIIITDTTAYDHATKQLKALIPVIAGKTLIPLPPMADDKAAVARFAGELEQVAVKSGQLRVLQFGAWLQSARLADDEHFVKMLEPSVVALLRKNLPDDSLTQSVMTAFNALSKLGAAKEIDVRKMRRTLDELYYSIY